MSHDETFPSLTRRGARWTAFTLAAAVLLGGGRVLADDGVFVHIDSPVPARIAEFSGHAGRVRGRVVAWSETRPLCNSPCDRRIYLNGNRYVITGQFPESPTLPPADLTDNVTITVQPGSYGRQTAGFFTTLWGVIFVAPGVSLVAIGSAEGDSLLPKVGVPFLVAGGVAAITGVVLLATSGTKVKLQQLGVSPVGSAAPVKPRYWMGEF